MFNNLEFQPCRWFSKSEGYRTGAPSAAWHLNVPRFQALVIFLHLTFSSLDQSPDKGTPLGSCSFHFYLFHLVAENRPIQEVKCPNSRKWVFRAKNNERKDINIPISNTGPRKTLVWPLRYQSARGVCPFLQHPSTTPESPQHGAEGRGGPQSRPPQVLGLMASMTLADQERRCPQVGSRRQEHASPRFLTLESRSPQRIWWKLQTFSPLRSPRHPGKHTGSRPVWQGSPPGQSLSQGSLPGLGPKCTPVGHDIT